MKTLTQNQSVMLLTAAILLTGIFFGTIFGFFSLSMGTIAMGGILLAAIFAIHPLTGLLVILFLRPLIDITGEYISIPFGDLLTLNATGLLGVFVIILAFFYFIIQKKHTSLWKLPTIPGIILLLLVLAMGTIYSIEPFESIREVIRVLSIVSIFMLTIALTEKYPLKKRVFLIGTVVITSAIVSSLVGLWQLLSGSGLGGTAGIESRIYGTFAHPNPFAAYILIALGIAVIGYLQRDRFKVLFAVLATFFFSIIVLTYSRGALLMLAIMATLIGIRYSWKLLLLFFACTIGLFFFSPTFHDRIEDIYNPPLTSSVYWRLEQWSLAYQSFLQDPIYGHGTGTEIPVHEHDYGDETGNPYTHNDILKFGVENGIIGIAAFLILWILFLFEFFLAYTRAVTPSDRSIIYGGAAIFMVLIGFSLSSNIWHSTAVMWALWALCASIFHQKRKSA